MTDASRYDEQMTDASRHPERKTGAETSLRPWKSAPRVQSHGSATEGGAQPNIHPHLPGTTASPRGPWR